MGFVSESKRMRKKLTGYTSKILSCFKKGESYSIFPGLIKFRLRM